jgi:Tol biopolymer transport system component
MSITAGTKLGPYEILAPLGAGGMGEVYRARDERLKRDIAIKVLPAELAFDADRRARFEREARAASGLSHPNILTIYDIGSADSTVYIAAELVEGGTLKDLVASGPLPTKKMLELATQIAEGLAAAHAAGIVHRDLKPANIMVSKHGYAKILDFGLAKLVTPDSGEVSALQTAAGDATRPGMVMGTAGYMSPEQAAGRAVDFRSDQFSFGSMLYEMATGQRAFERGTSAETLTAIIREEPAPVAQLNPRIPAPVRWIVDRCLAKDPEDRFGTTKDLARDLAAIRDHLSEAPVTSEMSGGTVAAATQRPFPWAAIAAAVVLAGVTGFFAFATGRKAGHNAPPSFRQLTFQRGQVLSARFAPDGQTVVYSASWEGRPLEIFVARLDSPESRPFGLKSADLLSISESGELAVALNQRWAGAFERSGMLARIGITGGGTPREIQEDVQSASWTPDGKGFAVIRDVAGLSRVESPIGKILYQTNGWLSDVRVSPKGDLVAFLEHPARGDDGGSVAIVDRAGRKTKVTQEFATEGGLAWSADGREVWFTAAEVGGNRALWAVTPAGSQRLLVRVTGNLTLQDVGPDGKVLIAHDTLRSGILAMAPGADKERDLSWLDWSTVYALTPDGKKVAFSESGEGGGPGYSTYLRNLDGSPPVRLGDGTGYDISPDGNWVIGVVGITTGGRLVLLPTGAGQPKPLPVEGLQASGATFLPDGKRLLVTAAEKGHGTRLYILGIEGGRPRAISPEGYRAVNGTISPDGRFAAAVGPDRKAYLYPLEGGEPAPLAGLADLDVPLGWTADGRSLYVYKRGEYPARVFRLDPATGKREFWKELTPPDPAGINTISPPRITPDGKAYVYSYNRILSDLFLAEGVK